MFEQRREDREGRAEHQTSRAEAQRAYSLGCAQHPGPGLLPPHPGMREQKGTGLKIILTHLGQHS